MYKLDNLVLFTNATCNLQCKYCNIDKSEILNKIDRILEESFLDENYYFNQIKKYYPEKDSLISLEIWGGEPFLEIERIFPLLDKIIQNYPYFNKMRSSTNHSFSSWCDKFFRLMKIFSKYSTRNFTYELQLSCDGPEYINDLGRGKGTTEKCLKNFQQLVNRLEKELPSNVHLVMYLKPTLSLDTIQLLNTPEKIIEYYSFFEKQYLEKIYSLDFSNVKFYRTLPNMAVPCPATKKDGEYFAKFIKMCRKIERKKVLKYYDLITPFSTKYINDKDITYYHGDCLCGCGVTTLGLLPNYRISICNEGFTELIEEYKIHFKNNTFPGSLIEMKKNNDSKISRLCLTEDEFKSFQNDMKNFICPKNTSTISQISSSIVMLALTGQIKKKYIDLQEATRAAEMIVGQSYCIKDNFNITGSITMVPIGMLRLLLNGALDYIWSYKND